MAKQTTSSRKQWRRLIVPIPQRNGKTHSGGDKLYRVQLQDDAFYLAVDNMEVMPNGELVGKVRDNVLYAFGAGKWLFCVPISALDGSELVESWDSRWLRS